MGKNKTGKIIADGKEISLASRAYIIAEAACNHICDMDIARKMIDEAAKAGSDAIKFQTYKAEKLVCSDSTTYWNHKGGSGSQLDYYKKLDKFGKAEYRDLFSYAKSKGITAFSTPFDVDSAKMLNDIGMPLFKIASCDILDTRLIRTVAGFGKPVIISTGASTIEEIKKTVTAFLNTGNSQLVLMACTLSYPTNNDNAHMARISTFRRMFPDIVIGLSDHTEPDENMVIPSVAVSLGAKVIEKHYTLDRSMTGSGHSFSINPTDLKKMVDNIRLTEKVLGSAEIKIFDVEAPARTKARRSLVAEEDIEKGARITSELIGVKRPGTGLAPDRIDEVIGRTANVNIKKDAQIRLEELE